MRAYECAVLRLHFCNGDVPPVGGAFAVDVFMTFDKGSRMLTNDDCPMPHGMARHAMTSVITICDRFPGKSGKAARQDGQLLAFQAPVGVGTC